MSLLNTNGLRLLLLIALFALSAEVVAQKQANWWYFGRFAGLNFNNISNGLPEAMDNGDMDAFEANSTVSDDNGELLFYTDGRFVWDAKHDTMPNGKGLLGHSSTNQCIVVPNPGNPDKYYVFHNDYMDFRRFNGFAYTEVDMSLRGGLGDVVQSTKNTILADTIAERITAIKMKGRTGYWVIVHQPLKNNVLSNNYLSYAVTPAGVNPVPVVSNVGPAPKSYDYSTSFKASPCGDKIATAFQNSGSVVLFDFDATTGRLSNPRSDIYTINVPRRNLYGIEFSEDGALLYVARTGANPLAEILQYSTMVNTSAAFVNSRVSLKDPLIDNYRGMQRGPDGKIYFLYGDPRLDFKLLGVIQYPNLPGTACNVDPNGPVFSAKVSLAMELGLPNFVGDFSCPDPIIKSAQFCEGEPTQIWLYDPMEKADSAVFNFGDPSSEDNISQNLVDSHKFSQSGSYEVSAVYFRTYGGVVIQDTVSHQIEIIEVPQTFLGPDTALCPGDSLLLVSDGADSISVWNSYKSERALFATSFGEFFGEVEIKDGCFGFDTIRIDSLSEVQLKLISDTLLCEPEIYIEPITADAKFNYLWNDGISAPDRIVNEPGRYVLTATGRCGQVSDTINIESCLCEMEFPNVFTPNGDGINDAFAPLEKCSVEQFLISVYNRWGLKVFESKDIDKLWDGSFKNRSCSSGVYFWEAQYLTGNDEVEVKKGHVTLISDS